MARISNILNETENNRRQNGNVLAGKKVGGSKM